jgi:hypothetical protein
MSVSSQNHLLTIVLHISHNEKGVQKNGDSCAGLVEARGDEPMNELSVVQGADQDCFRKHATPVISEITAEFNEIFG